MPTREDHITTNDPWTLKSKNPSKSRDMVTEQKSATNQLASKNKGSLDKERPHQTTESRSKGNPVLGFEGNHVSVAQKSARFRNNPSKGSGDLFGEKSVKAGGVKGSAPEHPEPRINSGKTKIKTYPSGRNRGRNYKG